MWSIIGLVFFAGATAINLNYQPVAMVMIQVVIACGSIALGAIRYDQHVPKS